MKCSRFFRLDSPALGNHPPALDLPRTANHEYDAPVPGSYQLPILMRTADGEVLDCNGQPLRLSELTYGRVTVMSFIYTRCASANACPMATTKVRAKLGTLIANERAGGGKLLVCSASVPRLFK